jgi:hypothetical protein
MTQSAQRKAGVLLPAEHSIHSLPGRIYRIQRLKEFGDNSVSNLLSLQNVAAVVTLMV